MLKVKTTKGIEMLVNKDLITNIAWDGDGGRVEFLNERYIRVVDSLPSICKQLESIHKEKQNPRVSRMDVILGGDTNANHTP